MVVGLKKFKEYFQEYTENYLIIGGTACDIIIESGGFVPRATDDIDIVLIIEVLSPEFGKRFWDFIADGNYTLRQKDSERRNCYRFCNPQTADFPVQIELFCKTPDAIELFEDAHLTPIPTGEGLSNLSAILLDEDYYHFTIEHSTVTDNVHFANIEALICLKAFAYLDNKKRREAGEEIKTRDIIKHKYDVFRMVFMLTPDDRFLLDNKLKADLQFFAETVKYDLPDPGIFKANRFGEQDMQLIYERFLQIFDLKP
ncbi:MAG: hypothetical protein JZU47_10025 [Prolixibacteraceae bacterium]|nr:hypothetical protein [Prolixibacteraceae bacterium]